MEPKKDFDPEEFNRLMMNGFYRVVQMEQRARTFKELEMIDELEVEVSSRPCYSTVDEMIEAIKGM